MKRLSIFESGQRSINKDQPCRDYTEVYSSNDGGAAICLSSGNHKKEFSHYGSRTICKATADFILSYFDKIYNAESNPTILSDYINHIVNELLKEMENIILMYSETKDVKLPRILYKFQEKLKVENIDEKVVAKKVADRKNTLVRQLEEKIMAIKNADIDIFESNMVCCAIKNNKFFTLHIGSGFVGAMSNGIPLTLSFATQKENDKSAYITDKDAIKKISYNRGDASTFSTIFVGSQGLNEIFLSDKLQFKKSITIFTEKFEKTTNVELVKNEILNHFRKIYIHNTKSDLALSFFNNPLCVHYFQPLEEIPIIPVYEKYLNAKELKTVYDSIPDVEKKYVTKQSSQLPPDSTIPDKVLQDCMVVYEEVKKYEAQKRHVTPTLVRSIIKELKLSTPPSVLEDYRKYVKHYFEEEEFSKVEQLNISSLTKTNNLDELLNSQFIDPLLNMSESYDFKQEQNEHGENIQVDNMNTPEAQVVLQEIEKTQEKEASTINRTFGFDPEKIKRDNTVNSEENQSPGNTPFELNTGALSGFDIDDDGVISVHKEEEVSVDTAQEEVIIKQEELVEDRPFTYEKAPEMSTEEDLYSALGSSSPDVEIPKEAEKLNFDAPSKIRNLDEQDQIQEKVVEEGIDQFYVKPPAKSGQFNQEAQARKEVESYEIPTKREEIVINGYNNSDEFLYFRDDVSDNLDEIARKLDSIEIISGGKINDKDKIIR